MRNFYDEAIEVLERLRVYEDLSKKGFKNLDEIKETDYKYLALGFIESNKLTEEIFNSELKAVFEANPENEENRAAIIAYFRGVKKSKDEKEDLRDRFNKLQLTCKGQSGCADCPEKEYCRRICCGRVPSSIMFPEFAHLVKYSD